MAVPKSILELKNYRSQLIALATDMDDTITDEGKLPSHSLQGLERLRKQGLRTIIITGRPAGWCDMIARFFPVDAVIGENGAFLWESALATKGKVIFHDLRTNQDRSDRTNKMPLVEKEILQKFPHLNIATDQSYRRHDLAIDFAEESRGTLQDAVGVKKIFEAHGATAKISSIHVNGWFGNQTKESGLVQLEQLWQINRLRSKIVYVGDSPNDQPLFEFVEHSVGVASIRNYEPPLTPAYVTVNAGSAGFLEVVDVLCD